MENSRDIAAYLRHQAESYLGFLIERGFYYRENETVDTPTLVEITLSAKKVAVILSFDRREQTTGLYVAKVRDGRITHRGEGGYYGDFSAYLRKYCRFRGSISDGMSIRQLQALSLEDRIKRDIQVYAKALQAYASRIIDDTEEFA